MDLPASDAPAPWWDVEADVGLLAGLYKHGFNRFEEIRRDPELVGSFQVSSTGGTGACVCMCACVILVQVT